VIGKATPTATPIHHKPIQVLVRQLLSLQVQYQEQFPHSTGGATQTNGEPMSYSQLRSHGLQQPLALSAGNFVIGKDTNSDFSLIHHKPIQVLVKQRQLLFLQVQQEEFPIFLPEEQQLKLMQEPMWLQPTSFLRT
jgi:hypothetical protein